MLPCGVGWTWQSCSAPSTDSAAGQVSPGHGRCLRSPTGGPRARWSRLPGGRACASSCRRSYRWDELVARLDLVLRGQLLVLEPDGAVKFDGPGVLPNLLARQEGIRNCGLDVVRVGWGDVAGDTRPFGDRVRRRLAEGSLRRLAPGVRLVASRVQPVGPPLPSYVGWPLAG